MHGETIREKDVKLASGRIIQLSEGGDPEGLPVFSMHGMPGSRLLFGPHVHDAKQRGIRLIGYSRPGYGDSTRLEGRRIADAATDVGEIADHLGIRDFAVWGFSGGGAYALACAALVPDRVVAASSLSTLGPYGVDGFDFYAGMIEPNVEDYKLMLTNRAEWEAKSRTDTEAMVKPTKADRMKFAETFLSDPDKAANTDEVDDYFQSQIEEGLRRGIDGTLDDQLATAMPWGFDLASIHVPLQVWHGKQDRFSPFVHGQWLASRMPQAEAHLEENDGHVSMFVNRIPEVQRWLAARF